MPPAWAASFVGIPFAPHGRTRSGCDCWGLVRLALDARFGIALPEYADGYERSCDAQATGPLIEARIPEWIHVKHGLEIPGDVLLFRRAGHPAHVGLVIEDGLMLHTATEAAASCIESYRGPKWGRRVFGIYRHPATT